MKYITDYFWIILIGVTAANAAAWWRYARPHIARKPELRQGYKRLILNFVFWGSIPWLVMGLGLSVGSAASIYDYLKPREANLWVLGWYATWVGIWVRCLWWLFRQGGAQTLADHPGLLNIPLSRAEHVKLLACGVSFGQIAGVIAAFCHDMPSPSGTNQADGYTTYFVVYDGFWGVVAFAFLFLAVGAVGLYVAVKWIGHLKISKQWTGKEKTKPTCILVGSIFWLSVTGIAFSANLYLSYRLVSVYRNGTAELADGTVHVLHRQPESGHAEGDVIMINGVRLVVDYFELTPAYRRTIAHGGVLHEGKTVRVWHHNGKILRLDVKR